MDTTSSTSQLQGEPLEAAFLNYQPPMETACCGRKWLGRCGYCGVAESMERIQGTTR